MHCCDLCQGPLCVIGREGPVDLLMCCGCFMTFRQAAAATPLPPHDPAPRTEVRPAQEPAPPSGGERGRSGGIVGRMRDRFS